MEVVWWWDWGPLRKGHCIFCDLFGVSSRSAGQRARAGVEGHEVLGLGRQVAADWVLALQGVEQAADWGLGAAQRAPEQG